MEKDLQGNDPLPISASHVDSAADALMKRRDTHIDLLLERLKGPRVQRVIEPMLAGTGKEGLPASRRHQILPGPRTGEG
ncbi:MAG: hypothetical protein LBE84_11995 [Planctomycetota bacterium]|nr:hypothetical protein [Planctomycetota bacterium]